MYSAGATLKLNFGTFFHYGIADGQGNVIHNSKKKLQVAIDSYNDFADGKEIEVSEISSTDPTSAATIAISYIGLPHNLVDSNCEHFAMG